MADKWYKEVTKYQWLVLAIASAGWMFDVFEGQLFNITRGDMLPELLSAAGSTADVSRYGDLFLGVFLLGGTLGGLLFGSLADKWGRRRVMGLTILMYSAFTGLTFFAQTLWHVAALRFLVAMGVGGEWAVAAALVAEVFPPKARARAAGIFHATSVGGTWLAAIGGLLVGTHWRYAYLLGIVPAILIFLVRIYLKEPESWANAEKKAAQGIGGRLGSFKDLLSDPNWRGRAILGMLLAAVGLGTFWGVTVAGQDLTKELLLRTGMDPSEVGKRAKFAYGIVQTAGGGLGLLAFGPLCVRLGRKKTFLLLQAVSLVIVPMTCFLPRTYWQMLLILPFFGFFTLGTHAGFAIYFPELFPTRLRGTGSAFCFNGGRLLAAPMLWFSGWLKGTMDLRPAVTLLGLTFVLGILVVSFLPETKDQPLPEEA